MPEHNTSDQTPSGQTPSDDAEQLPPLPDKGPRDGSSDEGANRMPTGGYRDDANHDTNDSNDAGTPDEERDVDSESDTGRAGASATVRDSTSVPTQLREHCRRVRRPTAPDQRSRARVTRR